MASGGSTVLDEYEWEKLPDMLVARCYSVAAYNEGKLYVFGERVIKSVAGIQSRIFTKKKKKRIATDECSESK